jgi:hypothetical protein
VDDELESWRMTTLGMFPNEEAFDAEMRSRELRSRHEEFTRAFGGCGECALDTLWLAVTPAWQPLLDLHTRFMGGHEDQAWFLREKIVLLGSILGIDAGILEATELRTVLSWLDPGRGTLDVGSVLDTSGDGPPSSVVGSRGPTTTQRMRRRLVDAIAALEDPRYLDDEQDRDLEEDDVTE